MPTDPARVMFLYWGRRGPLSRFTLDLAQVVKEMPQVHASFSISRQNESFPAFREFSDQLFPIDTFITGLGAFGRAWRIPMIRRLLARQLKRDRTEAVIVLMPHVWTPFLAKTVRSAGARYVTLVHDADAHPGDPTSLVHGWNLRDVLFADAVLTLSSAVAGRLEATGKVPPDKLFTLFHPDLCYGPPIVPELPMAGEPFRLLFMGRILSYKGLPMLLDAIDIVRAAGIPVHLSVCGEGPLGPSTERLARIGATIVNKWLTEKEIEAALGSAHAVVLSHVEASQSGVAAAAFGRGIPVVCTPVGGLPEQVSHGQLGVIATNASGPSLADAIIQLCTAPLLYNSICRNIRATRDRRSMRRFVEMAVSLARGPDQPG